MGDPEAIGELSWFELFVDPTCISKSIQDPEKKKILPKLCMQFTDKGFLAEREKDKGKLSVEDLLLFERKSASMRLCAMATLASMDYDIEYIIDNIHRNELQTLRVLADNFYRIYNEKNLDATFGNWLFYRFVLSIDRRNRLNPPAPRATIATTLANGQLMPTDPALLKHDKTQRTIGELREHLGKAKAFITELMEVPRDIVAPGIQCFLKPFVELAPKSMTAALVGNRDVLIENPSPDFEAQKIILPAADVANKCLSELVVFHFTNGEIIDARKLLMRIARPKSTHPIVAIDENVFRSYCQILHVQGTPFSPGTVIRPFVFDLNTLNDDRMRSSELYRHRGATETTGQLQSVYKAENAALSVIDAYPECIREAIKTPAEIERFAKILKKKLEKIRDKRRLQLIRAHLQYLCASIPDFRVCLEANGVDVSELRTFAVPSQHWGLERPPTVDQLASSLRGTDPFWTLMTEFDVNILKRALVELGPFWFPNKMFVSEFLLDKLETRVNTPIYTLTRLLLAKLYQLSRMRNYQGFVDAMNAYSNDLGVDMGIDLAFESIYVKSMIGNDLMPWRIAHFEIKTSETTLIFNQDHMRTNENSAKMYNQCMSLMLNLGDHQTVFERGGLIPIDIFKCIPIARMFGAFVQSSDESVAKKCADGFWRTMTPKLVDAQPRLMRRVHEVDQRLAAARKELNLLFHMFQLLKEKRLVDFIVAYLVAVHNRLMVQEKKSHKIIHAKLLHLYYPESNSKVDISSTDDVKQLLRIMVEKAYSMSKTDDHAIRTYADLLFVEGEYQAAAQKYMEYFAAQEPLFRIVFAQHDRSDEQRMVGKKHDTYYDESIFIRLRACLAHSGFLTLSFLTCQWMRTGKAKAYAKALQLLRMNETRDVGANCAEFITDIHAIELLSQLYHEKQMMKSLQTLYHFQYVGGSTLSNNQNTGQILIREELRRRTSKMLTCVASTYFGLHV